MAREYLVKWKLSVTTTVTCNNMKKAFIEAEKNLRNHKHLIIDTSKMELLELNTGNKKTKDITIIGVN